MTTIVAGATGNWSATGTWVGGVVPGAGDTAQTGNYTVTINVSVTCTLNPTGSGHFEVTTGGITITGNVNMNSSYTSGGLRCTHSSGTVTVTGAITAGTLSYAHGAYNNGTGTLTVGTATGGTGNSANGAYNNGTGTLTVGTATGGGGNSAHGASNNAAGTLTVGTATGGGGTGTYAYGAVNYAEGTLTVGTAVGNNWGPGGTHPYWSAGVYGYNATGCVTKVGAIQFGPYGASPVFGAVLLDDSVTNTAEFRTVLNGATKTLEESGGGGGGGLFYPVVGASIIRGVKI